MRSKKCIGFTNMYINNAQKLKNNLICENSQNVYFLSTCTRFRVESLFKSLTSYMDFNSKLNVIGVFNRTFFKNFLTFF